MTTTPIAWPEAQRICDTPEVRELIDAFAGDSHEENMLAMVSAIMGHASAQGRAAGLEEIIDMLDKFGALKYRAGCASKNYLELLEQAHAYRHMIHEALAALSPTPSVAGKDDARELDAKRYQMLRRGQKWSVIDGIGNTLRAEELDAAIDAAIAAQGERK